MARLKDLDWNLPDGTKNRDGSVTHDWSSVHSALLMDIRDELKRLNRLSAIKPIKKKNGKARKVG